MVDFLSDLFGKDTYYGYASNRMGARPIALLVVTGRHRYLVVDGPTLSPVEVPIFGLILPTQTANTQYTTEVIPSSSAPSETDDTCPIRQILWENNWGRNLYNTVYSIQYTCDTYGNKCHNCVQYNLSPEQGRPSRGPKRVYHTPPPSKVVHSGTFDQKDLLVS